MAPLRSLAIVCTVFLLAGNTSPVDATCTFPTNPALSFAAGCATTTGTTCQVSCKAGWSGAATTATCLATGRWRNLPRCTKLPTTTPVNGCTRPQAPYNGSRCPARTAVNAKCSVSCGAGTTGTASVATCTSGGVWTRLPTCTPTTGGSTTCPPLQQITGADVSACTARAPGSTSCTVSCLSGFTGNPTTYTCTLVGSTARWVGNPPISCAAPPVTGGSGYITDVPTNIPFLSGSGCANYNPSSVNWQAVHDAFITYFAQAGTIGPDNIPYSRVATLAIRTAFHDAGTNNGATGGADGSILLDASEQARSSNTFPFSFVPYVRAAVTSIMSQFSISWADGIVMAGIAGAHFINSPTTFNVQLGRCDVATANPDVLPMANINYRQYTEYWSMVGINIRDAVALLGVHSAIDTNKGGDPVNWSSSMYRAQTTGTITITNSNADDGPDGVSWTGGVWKYTVNDALVAPQQIELICPGNQPPNNPQCPFKAQFVQATNDFAQNQGRWNNAFNPAYDRMTRIGATWCPTPAQATLIGNRRPPPQG